MKDFTQIQKHKLDGDYDLIAKATGQSRETVKKKVLGKRKDTHQVVQKAFNILISQRQANQSNEQTTIKTIKERLAA